MSKFKHWLLISPIDDVLFFANLRELARAIHLWRGHRWVEHTASCDGLGRIYEVRIRMCIDCELKEIMNDKGEWVKRE
jgi:hypothetical protein